MKFRTDFITNSSSSSFAISRKSEKLTEKQKEIILDYVENVLLGKLTSLPKNSTPEEMEEFFDKNYLDLPDGDYQSIIDAVDSGEKIYLGDVYFDEEVEKIRNIYQNLWERLDGVDGFRVIDGYLEY